MQGAQDGHIGSAIRDTTVGLSRYAQAAVGTDGLGPAHAALLDYVPDASDVLDVGCSSGYLAAKLVERGCHVVGIELDPSDAEAARKYCDSVIEADVETLDLDGSFTPHTFDVVVFGDVLEHLRAPEKVLTRVRPFLRPGGHVAVSIPNVAHASIRLQLLLGQFWYTPVGLLDDTHLRFFTLDTFTAMSWGAGFGIDSLTRIEEPINPDVWAEMLERLPLGDSGCARLAQYLAEPSSTTFQYVMQLSERQPESQAVPYPERPPWTRSLTEYLAERDELVRQLQEQVDQQTRWALASTDQVRERDDIIRQLQTQLAEQTAWAQRSAAEVRTRDEIIRNLQKRAS